MQRNDFSSKTFLWGFQQYFAQYPCFIALLYFPFQPNATHLRFKPGEIAIKHLLLKFWQKKVFKSNCASGLWWQLFSDASLWRIKVLRKMLFDLLANFYFLSESSELFPYLIFFNCYTTTCNYCQKLKKKKQLNFEERKVEKNLQRNWKILLKNVEKSKKLSWNFW